MRTTGGRGQLPQLQEPKFSRERPEQAGCCAICPTGQQKGWTNSQQLLDPWWCPGAPALSPLSGYGVPLFGLLDDLTANP